MIPRMVRSMWQRSAIRPGGFFLSGFFVLVLSTGAPASDETIPPESWVYPALRTFELKGLVSLEPSLPYTRSGVEHYLGHIREGIEKGGVNLSERQRFLLERLRREFEDRASRPRDREDRPVYVHRDEYRFFAIDFTAGGVVQKRIDREKGEADALLVPSILIDLGGGVSLETAYRVRMEPERDSFMPRRKPSPREKSFRGVTMAFERGYITAGGNGWRVHLGREYVHWGGGRSGGLLLSRTAGSLDHLLGAVTVGRFTLSAIHAFLDPARQRHLAGHRLTVRLPRDIRLGVGESVVYTGRGLDFTYLFPVVSYYANQYNERGDDNVLVGIDIKVPVHRGVLLYGELLIDDFQYESDPPAPDRLGYTVAAEALVSPAGRDLEIHMEYTFIDIFTYAHRDSLVTRYVAGNGAYPENPLLGSPLGPDADRWRFAARAAVHPRVVLGMEGNFVRRGDGNDLGEWGRGDDPDPPFPSGTVIRENRYGVSLSVDLGSGSGFTAGGGWMDRSSAGESRRESYAFMELLLDF